MGASYRGVDTRVCRVETRFDALGLDFKTAGIQTSLDAAG